MGGVGLACRISIFPILISTVPYLLFLILLFSKHYERRKRYIISAVTYRHLLQCLTPPKCCEMGLAGF